MARWITVQKPFDYHWPGRAAITVFRASDCGEHLVKDEVADFAVGNGYASEGKLDGTARSKKGNGKRVRAKKERKPAKAADTGAKAGVDHEDAPAADRAADRGSVDSSAG